MVGMVRVLGWDISQWLQDPLFLQLVSIAIGMLPILFFLAKWFPWGFYSRQEIRTLRKRNEFLEGQVRRLELENRGLQGVNTGEEKGFKIALDRILNHPIKTEKESKSHLSKQGLVANKKPTIDAVNLTEKKSNRER